MAEVRLGGGPRVRVDRPVGVRVCQTLECPIGPGRWTGLDPLRPSTGRWYEVPGSNVMIPHSHTHVWAHMDPIGSHGNTGVRVQREGPSLRVYHVTNLDSE